MRFKEFSNLLNPFGNVKNANYSSLHHIFRLENAQADFESRRLGSETEFQLSEMAFCEILKK